MFAAVSNSVESSFPPTHSPNISALSQAVCMTHASSVFQVLAKVHLSEFHVVSGVSLRNLVQDLVQDDQPPRPISLHFIRSLPSKRDRRARKSSFDLLTAHALRSDGDCEVAVKIVFAVQPVQPRTNLCRLSASINKPDEVAVVESLVVRK